MENMRERIQPGKGDGPEALGEILTCSGERELTRKQTQRWEIEVRNDEFIGISSVRWAVLVATGFETESKMDIIVAENERKKGSRTLNAMNNELDKLDARWHPRSAAHNRSILLARAKKAFKTSVQNSPSPQIKRNRPR